MNTIKPLSQQLFVLRTSTNRHVGFYKCEKSYVVTFPNIEHASLANKNISNLTMFDISPRQDLARTSHLVDLCIFKNHNIKTNICKVEETDMTSMFVMPIVDNVGVVVALDVVKDDPSELVFESILIDPFDDPKHFRPSI